MRLVRLLVCAACLGLLAAAPASGTVRHAAPGAVGAAPCNPVACPLPTAIAVANPGDQVAMASGTYSPPAGLDVEKAIEVGGTPGSPQPQVVFAAGEGATVDHAGAVLHDVRLELSTPQMPPPLVLIDGAVERVYADGINAGSGCVLIRGTIRNSVCRDGLNVSPSGAGSYQATVTNVTADPLLVGAHSGANLAVSVTNTLALPDTEGGGSEEALSINVGVGASAAVLLTNSSYNGVSTTLSTGTAFEFTPAGTNGNQTVAPLLADPSAGDFRQLPGSPTIDAGTTAVDPLGPLDLLGAARVQPRCIGGTPVPDIGAYELTPTEACESGAPAPTTAPAPGPSPVKSNFGFGKLKYDKAKGTATLAVKLRAAGALRLSGKGIVGRKLSADAAKTVEVKIKARGAKAEALRTGDKVKLQAKFEFLPSSAAELPTTKTRPITLHLRPDG